MVRRMIRRAASAIRDTISQPADMAGGDDAAQEPAAASAAQVAVSAAAMEQIGMRRAVAEALEARQADASRQAWPKPTPIHLSRTEGDAFASAAAGYGPGEDTIHDAEPVPPPTLDVAQARALCSGGLFRRIVNVIPEDALSSGWRVNSGEARDVAADIDTTHNVWALALQAWQLARRDTYAVWWVRTAGETGEPMTAREIGNVIGLTLLEADECDPIEWDDDPSSPTFGDVLVWRVGMNRDGPASPSFQLHGSRAIVWRLPPGGPSESRRGRNLPGTSIVEAYFWAVLRLDYMLQVSARLVGEASIPVLTRASRASVSGSESAEQLTAVRLWNQIRSVFRVTMLGPGDEFTRVPTNATGIAELTAQEWSHVAAHEGIPISRLTMQPPPGLSNNDASGDAAYRQLCKRRRRLVAQPALARWYDIAIGPDPERSIAFGPVDVPSAKEQAEISKIRAERDAVLVLDLGMPARAALARVVGDEEQDLPVLSADDLDALEGGDASRDLDVPANGAE